MSAFRPYTSEFFEPCLAIARSNVNPFLDVSELPLFASFLRDEVPLDHCTYEVLVEDGQALACGGLAREGAIATFCWGLVHRDHHRRGLGSLLAERRIEQGHGLELRLNTSQHTVGFYERMGFVQFGFEANGYGPNLHKIAMRRAAAV